MAEQTTEKREKFTISMDQHFELDPIAESKFMTSNELCKLTSELFHQVFADFEGCKFMMNGNQPYLSLVFNHGEYGDGATVGVRRPGTETIGNTIIDRTRRLDNQAKAGDRYLLTDDGKDVISDLLLRNYFNYGKVNWGSIVSECTDNGPANAYWNRAAVQQYTLVNFISLDRLCSLLFGDKDIDGNEVEYSVAVISAINPSYNSMNQIVNIDPNYILNVTKVSAKELNVLCTKLGLTTGGLNIIR